jgi:hypothetical protein
MVTVKGGGLETQCQPKLRQLIDCLTQPRALRWDFLSAPTRHNGLLAVALRYASVLVTNGPVASPSGGQP